MPVTWNSDNKFKLMLAIMQVQNPSPPNWDQVASLLGPGATVEACRQQYKAIKKLAGKELQLDNSTVSASSTPRKRKAKDADEINGDLDDGTPQPTPSKTRAKKQKTPSAALKDESAGSDGTIKEEVTAV